MPVRLRNGSPYVPQARTGIHDTMDAFRAANPTSERNRRTGYATLPQGMSHADYWTQLYKMNPEIENIFPERWNINKDGNAEYDKPSFWEKYGSSIIAAGIPLTAGVAAGALAPAAATTLGSAAPAVSYGAPAALSGVGATGIGAGTLGAGTAASLAVPSVTVGAPAALAGTGASGVGAGAATSAAGGAGATSMGTAEILKLLAGSGGNPYLRLLLGSGLDILGGLLSGGTEREAYKGANTNPESTLDMAMRAISGMGQGLSERAKSPVQLRTTAQTPTPISSPGLPFQIGGGLATDPALQNKDLLNFPGLRLPDDMFKMGGAGQSTNRRNPQAPQDNSTTRRNK